MADFPAAWLALTDAQRDAYGATMGAVDEMVEETLTRPVEPPEQTALELGKD